MNISHKNRTSSRLLSLVPLMLLLLCVVSAAALQPDDIVRQVYRETLKREPDPRSLHQWRKRIVEQKAVAEDIRMELRKTEEWKRLQADALIEKVFMQALKRVPSPAERIEYRQKVLAENWNETRLRAALDRKAR